MSHAARPAIAVHWLRRDLRLEDNHGLFRALHEHGDVLPVFIFDTHILDRLEHKADRRVDHLHRTLASLKAALEAQGSTLLVMHGKPLDVWTKLTERYTITAVTANHDHEPYALQRDAIVAELLREKGITFRTFKDISIFERSEVMKDDGMPYTVFTPYARKWKALFTSAMADPFPSEKELHRLWQTSPVPMASLEQLGCEATDVDVPPAQVDDEILLHYKETRNLPGIAGTSRMSTHLRFGTISPRALVRKALGTSESYLNELIWREFFMQVLYHFPQVVQHAFKPAYDHIEWRNNEDEFAAWCAGRTGYPLVDAGMRELAVTGQMHNRVRMVTASFLTKHLLIDWRWGEAWFAQHLLDYELSSNNGNWQWAAGSGCDAAPWFRIFNPSLQQERFDPRLTYVKQWVPEYQSANYAAPIVVHKTARERAILAYKAGLAEKIAP
ncbi:MAG: deoxyribodipyrimidine photo-lyase [Flavobacteriales bacterium]|nr:deoxyribodipyrimidine photo-lyase [Flavobacteriales bacterium]